MRTPRMSPSVSYSNKITGVSDSTEPKIPTSKHVHYKKHRYTCLIAAYGIGIFLGALLIFQDTEWNPYVLMFLQTRLERFASASFSQIFAEKLHAVCLTLLTIFFVRYSALGAPILLVLVCGNGLIRITDLICVFSQIGQLSFSAYLCRCFLYDFGCAYILLPAAAEALLHSNTLFRFFFLKKRLPEAKSFSVNLLLGTFAGVLLWCLLVYTLNSLFSSAGF